jgi:hypothetical protein
MYVMYFDHSQSPKVKGGVFGKQKKTTGREDRGNGEYIYFQKLH